MGIRRFTRQRKTHCSSHRVVWVGRDLIAHPVPTPCHEQRPIPPAQGAQSPALPGRGQPQLLWAAGARASPPSSSSST